MGQFFDALCRLVEKNQMPGDLRAPLKRGKLFEFPYIPHDVLPKSVEPDVLEFQKQNFFLPFQYTIIEDRCGVTVLWDREPDMRGVFHERMFMDYVQARTDLSNFREHDSEHRAEMERLQNDLTDNLPRSTAVITYGVYKMADMKLDSMLFTGDVLFALCASEDGIIAGPQEMLAAPNCRTSALTNVNTAMQEIAYLNTPDRFILERTPKACEKAQHRKGAAKKRILRTFERPTYVILEPHEIWKQMGVDAPSGLGTDKAPHPRRAHVRRGYTKVLTSSRYKAAQGKVIEVPETVVKECWVGPHEATVNGKHYRVMLEK